MCPIFLKCEVYKGLNTNSNLGHMNKRHFLFFTFSSKLKQFTVDQFFFLQYYFSREKDQYFNILLCLQFAGRPTVPWQLQADVFRATPIFVSDKEADRESGGRNIALVWPGSISYFSQDLPHWSRLGETCSKVGLLKFGCCGRRIWAWGGKSDGLIARKVRLDHSCLAELIGTCPPFSSPVMFPYALSHSQSHSPLPGCAFSIPAGPSPFLFEYAAILTTQYKCRLLCEVFSLTGETGGRLSVSFSLDIYTTLGISTCFPSLYSLLLVNWWWRRVSHYRASILWVFAQGSLVLSLFRLNNFPAAGGQLVGASAGTLKGRRFHS